MREAVARGGRRFAPPRPARPYARPRATGDLRIWIRATTENAERVWTALVAFGAPLHRLTRDDLATDDLVFQIGVVPNRIDLRTSIGGVTFDDAWSRRTTVALWGLAVPIIGRDDLMKAKKAAGRPRDLADLAELEEGG